MVWINERDYCKRDYISLRRAELEESIRLLEFQLEELDAFEKSIAEEKSELADKISSSLAEILGEISPETWAAEKTLKIWAIINLILESY